MYTGGGNLLDLVGDVRGPGGNIPVQRRRARMSTTKAPTIHAAPGRRAVAVIRLMICAGSQGRGSAV